MQLKLFNTKDTDRYTKKKRERGPNVVVFEEELDAEGLEGLASNGVSVERRDAIWRQNARSDDPSGDALRHFTCSDEP
ncbi:hypothetical protein GBA52_024545 [Prunus armeniaca]|nr:hypothetical protein GBA52_024545 [Prunus armeniaca]